VLYGTLKNPALFYSVTGFHFSHEVFGYVYGKIYEVTDYRDPQKIFTYPLLVPSNNGSKVIAKEVNIEVGDCSKSNFWKSLGVFEGDLYKLEIVDFYPVNKKPHKSKAYTGNLKKIKACVRIVRINAPFYLW